VGGHRDIAFGFGAVCVFVFDSAIDTDAFAKALSKNGFGSGVHELVFERGAAGIYNKYIHFE
jgi:hypothetical protein